MGHWENTIPLPERSRVVMCLGDCFENGSCVKVLPADCDFEIGTHQLRYRRPGNEEYRSHFKGDAYWTRNRDGSIAVTEHHNIERICFQILSHGGKPTNLAIIGWGVRSTLKNRHIYDTLVAERLKGMARRGWVRKTQAGRWVITVSGMVEARKRKHQSPKLDFC